jgi:nicotinamidase-related amidase
MPITTLDARSALVVIDLQKGLLAYPTLQPIAQIIDRASELAAAFRRHALPVVLVNAAGRAPGRTDQPRRALDMPPGWTDIVPELGQQASDLAITKYSPSAFGDTALAAALRARGVTQVVVVGVATSNGVEATARAAYDLGFNVTLPLDAITDVDDATHEHTAARIFPRIAETGSTADLLALLSTRGAGHELRSHHRLVLRRRLPDERGPPPGRRRPGPPVPDAVRDASGRRTLVVHRQRPVGLLQRRRRLAPAGARGRLRRA